MTDERGEDGNLLPDSERLTRLGRFLRMTSMDELPVVPTKQCRFENTALFCFVNT